MNRQSFQHVLITFALIPVALPASAQTIGWEALLPRPRSSAKMVFDSTRNVSVLFGGTANDGVDRNDTWEWNGTQWTSCGLNRLAPPPRSSFGMAFDSYRGVVVLFGGTANGTALYSDTWEWNGADWIQRNVPGPSARYGISMAYDSERRVTVLTGGDNGTVTRLRDLWEWNGTEWTMRPQPPQALIRMYHMMAYDSARHKCVIFGGISPLTYSRLSDTWEWDGVSWRAGSFPGPAARSSALLVYDIDHHATVLTGGMTDSGAYLGDTWLWDGFRWTRGPDGQPRYSPAGTFDAARHRVIECGGGRGYDNDPGMWQWDSGAWSPVYGSPDTEGGFALAYDSDREMPILYGRPTWGASSVTETWIWNGAWIKQSGQSPPSRGVNRMAYDSARRQVVLFGTDDGNLLNETWLFNGQSWTRAEAIGPPARSGFGMCFDRAREKVVLFGGSTRTPQTALGDTWEWDGTSWSQRNVSGPSPRAGQCMAFDSVRNVVYLHGGGSGEHSGELWEWNGSAWTLRDVASPRNVYNLEFDSVHNQLVAISSEGTLVWRGSRWDRLNLSGTSPSFTGRVVYDSARQFLFAFWPGDSNYQYDKSWMLHLPCDVPTMLLHPQEQRACHDRRLTFHATADSAAPFVYQWQVWNVNGPWIPLNEGPGGLGILSGTRTGDLLIEHGSPNSYIHYRCVVSNACGEVVSNSVSATMCFGDINCDGAMDFLDYLEFLQSFSSLDPAADFNEDGEVDMFDYLDFLARLRYGC